jgi:hypothetical protein
MGWLNQLVHFNRNICKLFHSCIRLKVTVIGIVKHAVVHLIQVLAMSHFRVYHMMLIISGQMERCELFLSLSLSLSRSLRREPADKSTCNESKLFSCDILH